MEYMEELNKLKDKISENNYQNLNLFFINTNLSEKDRDKLIAIIENIKEEGCSCGCN